MSNTPETPAARARLVQAEGDGQPVWRVANEHTARAAVYVAPNGVKRAHGGEHPALLLAVDPDGTWRLTFELGGFGMVPPVVLASGHIDTVDLGSVDLPPAAGYRFTRHTRPDGTGCLWSHCLVIHPEKRATRGNRRCPNECPASDVEVNPYADDQQYDAELPDPADVNV